MLRLRRLQSGSVSRDGGVAKIKRTRNVSTLRLMKIYHGPPTAAFCVGVARLLKSPNERLKANADFPKKLMKIDQHYESEKIFLRSEKDIN